MKRFIIDGVPAPVVKVTKDSDLFQVAPTDPDFGKYAVLEARVNVEALRNIRAHGDEDAEETTRAEHTGISFEPNPRMQNLKTDVANDIRKSLLARDGQFHRKNRGILLTADDFNYDNKTGELSWVEADPKVHGCLDGGHTLAIIDEYVGSADWAKAAASNGKPMHALNQFVTIQIVKGIDGDQIPEVAGARNTSVNVEDFALGELAENFAFIKPVLEKAKLDPLVAFKQNQMRLHKLPIDVVGVLQRLTTLDNLEFHKDQDQPYHAYWSRAKTYKEFEKHIDNYKRLADLIPDALALPEYIILKYGEWYAKTSGKNNTGRGRFGATREVVKSDGKKKATKFHFLPIVKAGSPKEAPYQLLTDALAMPIMSTLRVIISTDKTKARWLEDPYEFLDVVGPNLVDSLNGAITQMRGQTTIVLKSKEVWKNLYIQAKTLAYELGVIEVQKRSV